MTPDGKRMQPYLLPKQLVIDSEAIERVDVFSQLQVALSELLDVLAGFGQDSPFTLEQKRACQAFPSLSCLWLSRPKSHGRDASPARPSPVLTCPALV